MKKISVFLIILILFSFFTLSGESLPDYEPYEEDEFPGWAHDLRRGEIIFFGTIPFTFFATDLYFDIYRYASSNFNPDTAPALFGNTTPHVLTKDEKLQIIYISVIFSSFLALIDYLLGEPWND